MHLDRRAGGVELRADACLGVERYAELFTVERRGFACVVQLERDLGELAAELVQRGLQTMVLADYMVVETHGRPSRDDGSVLPLSARRWPGALRKLRTEPLRSRTGRRPVAACQPSPRASRRCGPRRRRALSGPPYGAA